MKTILKKILFCAAITIIFSSCVALHSGYMSNSASLSSANFSYIKKDIKASDTATYFLGIGGFKESLVANAKEKLNSENTLQDNQALANITVNFKYSTYFGIVTTVECTISADIVEFYNGENRLKKSDTNSSKTSRVVSENIKEKENIINKKTENKFQDDKGVSFEIGEKVKYYDKISKYYINCIITEIESNTITVEYSVLFKKKTKKVDKNEIFKF